MGVLTNTVSEGWSKFRGISRELNPGVMVEGLRSRVPSRGFTGGGRLSGGWEVDFSCAERLGLLRFRFGGLGSRVWGLRFQV